MSAGTATALASALIRQLPEHTQDYAMKSWAY
jgi:hypothetical protein